MALGAWGLTGAGQAQAADWLARYRAALDKLIVPPRVKFHQQTQIKGWQTSDMAILFSKQEETWQADITEIDRKRTLSRTQIDPVSHKSRLAIYNGYVTHPERLAPNATFSLMPNTDPIQVAESSRWNEQTVNYLAFDNGTPIRELWLDPVSFLPVRVHWVDSGSYGVADIFMDFASVGESYWLPVTSVVQIKLNFWVPMGFERRVFAGPLDIETDYDNYDITTVPIVQSSPTSNSIGVATARSLDLKQPLKPTKNPFELHASTNKSTSLIADRIADFNLSKPEVVNPYTNLNILLTVTWANQQWQTYLFRFQTKQTLLPLKSAAGGDIQSIPLLGGGE